MTMQFIPAIDIKNGQAVRLRQGKMDDVTVFGDPVEVAGQWVAQGAKRLHVVDLDGASAGEPVNLPVVADIAAAHPDLHIQVGGGIRHEETVVKYLDAGVQWVILGTKVINEPHLLGDLCLEFPRHIIVGLDAVDGKVATEGWSKLSNHDLIDLAQHIEHDGAEAIIFTDIKRDGMMKGVNVEATRELAAAIHLPVFASGGITSLDDLKALKAVEDEGVAGAIMGRALYEGAFTLKEAFEVAEG